MDPEKRILELTQQFTELHSDLDSIVGKDKRGAKELLEKYKNDPLVKFRADKLYDFCYKYDVKPFKIETKEDLEKLKKDKLNLVMLKLTKDLMEAVRDAYYKDLNNKLKSGVGTVKMERIQ